MWPGPYPPPLLMVGPLKKEFFCGYPSEVAGLGEDINVMVHRINHIRIMSSAPALWPMESDILMQNQPFFVLIGSKTQNVTHI